MSLGMIDQDVGDLNVGDVIDMAINRETMALRKGRQENDQLQLEMVEAALERMGEGTYGLCLDCGEPIEIPRLEALPYARLCIACKTKEEQERRGRIP
ncbi:MAG: TraR/DksA family transcriptional regulator [Candidatus Hydrogenedentota bacterium]|nr:MAG: TraR/DksA family transcriptional regulator [Candidatus Hydrogenedentota bacterium]